MQNSLLAFSGGERIRKAMPIEEFYEVAQNDFSFMISSYWLKLRSKRELTSDVMKRALQLLFRNSDNLSLCLKKTDGGDLWYFRMEKEEIDFQVLGDEEDPKDVLEKESCRSFISNTGPLWRIKMTTSKEIPSNGSVSGEEFRFSNDVILSFHHGITDGSTSLRVCNGFLQILSDVINGFERDVYNSFGKFSDGKETERLLQKRKEYLERNPEIFEFIKSEMNQLANQRSIFTKVFPVPAGTFNKTKHLVKDLSVEDTAKLVNRFKSQNISFHAGFTAVANWTLMELLIENGCSAACLDIVAFHAINIRRFWEDNNPDFPQGCHIGPLRLMIRTERDVGKQFWAYAKGVHERLKKYIAEQRSLDEIIAYPLISETGSYDFKELFRNPPPLLTYYSTTNMGNLSSLPGTTDQVVIDWLTRSTSCHNLNIPMIHVLQTFKGKLLYGLDYVTRYVRNDVAEKYVEKIFQKLFYIISF